MRETFSKATAQWLRSGTALSALFPRELPLSFSHRGVRLVGEGALSALVSLLLARSMGTDGVQIAVFFSAAGLVHRLDALLEENRTAVWIGETRRANLRTAASLMALFLGVFLVYLVVMAFPGSHQEQAFGVAERWASIKDDTILSRRFGSFTGLAIHNLGVLGTFFLVSLVYRSLGALLVLSWNAALWAISLSLLMRRAQEVVVMSKALFFAVAWAAVLPHLLLEAASYAVASLASIYLSRALLLYSLGDERFRAVAGAVGRILLASLGLLLAAAFIESLLPGFVLSRLS